MFKVIIGLWVIAILFIILKACGVFKFSWIVALIPLFVSVGFDLILGGLILIAIEALKNLRFS